MKKTLVVMALVASISCLFCSCSTQLQIPTTQVHPSFYNYRYVYIIPTNTITGGHISGNNYGTSGFTNSTNPANVIAGVLMEKGYSILPRVQEDFLDKTLVVSFGELPKQNDGLTFSTCTILLQFRDAKTSELIASSKADGVSKNEWSFIHPTEADGVKNAIVRALEALF